RRDPAAVAAGFRYLLVHVFGGLVLLAGIALHYTATESFAFESLGAFPSGGGWSAILPWSLILAAFLLNAAVPPLGAWLPDAYPEATVTGAVFMTAFTTKSAVYVLIRGFAVPGGTELIVWLGAAMAIYGVVYAVLENDARRLLAYHIISQVGYMVCAVGIGSDLAVNGASAHAFAHILYKALLFMGAGAVLQVTGLRKLNEMGGLYKTMPITLGLYMIGAFAISAVPLFSGFVSKSMIVAAAGEDKRQWIFLMLTLASAGTFLHTGLKLPYYMFFGKDSGARGHEPPRNMLVAMGLAAAACVLIGVFPGLLYDQLPRTVDYHPYSVGHVTASLGMLGFTALGFFLLLKQLDPEPKISLDTDWFYRKGSSAVVSVIRGPLVRLESGWVGEIYEFVIRWPVLGVARLLHRLDTGIVDYAVMSVGRLTQAFSQILKTTVSGNAQHYGLLMAAGVLVLLALATIAL
ncbi:MAG TPA: Na(+)/H(+) antiporter subunit D, partial [Candidatus Latescibacteria bacterium]|nr:Na(+)/H(+) antiporter subunit D [Candidatus Latescibacterota bacterium]